MSRSGSLRRAAALAACVLALSATCSAYYHFLHFAGRNAPFVPIPEKFDLAALPNRTVLFFVAASGPEKLADGDSFAAVLSELRLAGRTWNGVETSALRVGFGGLLSPNTPQTTPHVEVTFGEVPPGLLALGGPTARADVVQPENGNAFVPITKALVILNSDLSAQRSSSSSFFLTAVHELGHTLSLQHTATSSVMSTDATRSSTKASPLGADDIAGLSVLYPTPQFAAGTGTITGRVTVASAGVNLASVVAMSSNGQAVSTLANPDGTYKIQGLRTGDYFVYAHALPPSVQSDLGPAEVVLPVDADDNSFPAGGSFAAQFYPGTQDARQAGKVSVKPGQNAPDINFAVAPKGAPGLYGVTTYSFPGQIAARPAYINLNQPLRSVMVAWGTGLTNNDQPASGLNVSILGGGTTVAPGGVHAYAPDPSFLQVNFLFTPFSGTGPRHVIFSTPSDLYVRPAALTLVEQPPPAVTSAASDTDANGGRTVTITGSNLSTSTRILFDGAPAQVLSADPTQGTLTVVPPPAPANYQTNIVALNSDGQPSLFLGSPVTYTYDWMPAGTPTFTLSSASQSAGTEAMIEINATNMTFSDGRTTVGFGSSDVVVKRLWVVSPTLLRANVLLTAGAQPSDTLVTVVSGLQVATLNAGFHVVANAAATITLGSDIVNADPAQSGVYPGSTAILPVANLPASLQASALTLKLNDVKAPIVSFDSEKITFQVPASVKPGPVVLRLTAGDTQVAPVFAIITPAPPVVQSVSVGGVAVDGTHPANPGDILSIAVVNLGDSGVSTSVGRIDVSIGGTDIAPLSAAAAMTDHPAVHVVRAVVPASVDTSDKTPIIVSFDGRASQPFTIATAKP